MTAKDTGLALSYTQIGNAYRACVAYQEQYLRDLRKVPTVSDLHAILVELRGCVAKHLGDPSKHTGVTVIGELVAAEAYAATLQGLRDFLLAAMEYKGAKLK